MDRDVAQMLLTKIDAIKTGLQKLATNSAPAAPESRSVPLTIEDQRRTDPEEIPEEVPEEDPEEIPEEEPEEEPEAPVEEPKTRTKK